MITNKSNIDKRIMNKDQINYSMNNQNGLTHKSQQQQVLHQQKPSNNAYNKNLNYYNQTSNQPKYNNKKKFNNNYYYSNGNNGNFKNYNQNYNSLNRNSKNFRHNNNQPGYNNSGELKYDSAGNSTTSPIVSSNSSSTNTASPPSNLESPKSDSLNSLNNNGANSVNNNNDLKVNKEELNTECVDKIKELTSVNVQVGNSCINKEPQQELNKKIDDTQTTNESTVTQNANNLARDLNNLQITNSSSKPHLIANNTSFKNNNQNYNANRNKSPYNQDVNPNVTSSTIKMDKYNYDKQQTSTVPINSSNTYYRQSNGKPYNNYPVAGYNSTNNLNNGNYNQTSNGNFKNFNRNKKTTYQNHLLNNKNQYSATNQSNIPNSLLNKNQPKLLMNPAMNGATNTNHAAAAAATTGNLSISQNQAIVPQMVPQNPYYYAPISYNHLPQNLNQSHNQHPHHLMPNQHHPYSQNCVQCATYVTTAQNAYSQFVQPNAYQYQQQFVTLPAAYAYNQNLTALNATEDVQQQQQQQNVNATTINYRNENNSIKSTTQTLDQQPQQANTGAILNQANHPQNANINVQNHPQMRQLNNYQMHYQAGKFNVNQQQLNNQQEMMANYLQQFSYNTYLGFPASNYAPQYLQSVSNESQLPPMNMMTNSITNMHPLHQQHTINQYAINQSGQLQHEQYATDQALSTIAAADSTTRSNSVNYDANTAGGNLVLANVAHQQNSIHQYNEQVKFYQDYNYWQQQQQQQKANHVYNNGNNNINELNMSSHNMASNGNYQPQAQQTDPIVTTAPTTAEQLNNNADSTVEKVNVK